MPETNKRIYDITVIGAGPVGLFAVFYAGMRGMSINLIDSLSQVGGQLNALYPEKYIYDMPGFPKIRAKELVEKMLEQANTAHPTLSLNQKICRIEPFPNIDEKDHYKIITESNEEFYSKTIVLALGMGAFQPRKIDNPELVKLEGKRVHYVLKPLSYYQNKDILLIGGGDSAADWTLALAQVNNDTNRPISKSITQIHRGSKFTAHESTVASIQQTQANVLTNHILQDITVLSEGENLKIKATIIHNLEKKTQELIVDDIIICTGYVAKLDFVQDSGIAMHKNSILVDDKMETNLPGIFAAGDVVQHSSKLKLIATGVGEATIAANYAKILVDPNAKAFPGHSTTIMAKKK